MPLSILVHSRLFLLFLFSSATSASTRIHHSTSDSNFSKLGSSHVNIQQNFMVPSLEGFSWHMPRVVNEMDMDSFFWLKALVRVDAQSMQQLLVRSALPALETAEQLEDGRVRAIVLEQFCLQDMSSYCLKHTLSDEQQDVVFQAEIDIYSIKQKFNGEFGPEWLSPVATYSVYFDGRYSSKYVVRGNVLQNHAQVLFAPTNLPSSLSFSMNSVVRVEHEKRDLRSHQDSLDSYRRMQRFCSYEKNQNSEQIRFLCSVLSEPMFVEELKIRFYFLDQNGEMRALVLERPAPLASCHYYSAGAPDCLRMGHSQFE